MGKGLAVLAILGCTAWAGAAWGQDVPTCVAAHEKGQVLRRDGKLVLARKEFVGCVADACPTLVQEDCARRLAELEASTPTIVFEARDASGVETSAVTVRVDGVEITDRLDGRAIPLDPGEHRVTFEAKSGKRIERTVLLGEGEKNKKLAADFSEGAIARLPTKPASPPPPPTRGAPAAEEAPGIPTAAYVLGGIGILGLGAFTVFGLMGRSTQDRLENQCKPYCDEAGVDEMYRQYAVADVSLYVGVGALLAAGIVVLVDRSHAHHSTPPKTSRTGWEASRGLSATF